MTDAMRLDTLLDESRTFPPPESFRRAAHAASEDVYAEAARDPQAYWEKWAGELTWYRKWDRVLEWEPPQAKWFLGGRLNASVNCLDRHLGTARRNKAALIWEGEPGDRRTSPTSSCSERCPGSATCSGSWA